MCAGRCVCSARAVRVQCLLVQRVAVGQHREEGGRGQRAQHRRHDVEHLEEEEVVVEVEEMKVSGLDLGWRA